MSTPPNKVIIVGGGITGLTAAWTLQKAGIAYALIESSPRLGGKLFTQTREGFTMELGADAILRRKPWALQLAQELGLSSDLQNVIAHKSGTYILHRGRPQALPAGMPLLVPGRWDTFLASPLFSPWAKLRVALEPLIPARKSTTDETLASFVKRRFGREMLQKVAEPMLAGVFNADAERLSLQASFPQFPAMEREHGSLIHAARIKKAPNKTIEAESPFFSFQGGAQKLVDILAAKLTGEILLNTKALNLEKTTDGFQLTTSDNKKIEGTAVILASPAIVAAQLLEKICPAAAQSLNAFRSSSIGTAYFAYHRAQVAHPLQGYGMLIPSDRKKSIDGVTWSSSKWSNRAPERTVLLRTFFGGPQTKAVMSLSDGDALKQMQKELEKYFGITGQPIFTSIYRWADGYPQYDLGHLQRVAAVEAALPATIKIAGCAYRGIGVPDCVKQGGDAAAQLIANLSQKT